MRGMSAAVDVVLSCVELVEVAGRRELHAMLCVPHTHAVLAGHFPGAPVVPGVLLVDAVRRACEQTFHHTYRIVDIAVRFFQPVQPAETATLSAQPEHGEHGLDVEGEWRGAAGRIATFRLRLQADA